MAKESEDLVILDLPLPDGKTRLHTMALVHQKHAQGCQLLLSDIEGSAGAIWHLTRPGGELPPELEARSLGTLSAFLASHGDGVRRATLGGAARHGRLTLARAVQLLATQPLAPDEAVQMAVGASIACENWLEDLSREARALASG